MDSMVNSAWDSAETPRAHITKITALESLRGIGLEDEFQ